MATIMQIRIDSKMKSKADNLFSSLGLDLSTAVRMFLAAALQENGLPFAVKKRRFNAETAAALEDAKHGKNLSGPYKNAREMIAAALREDDNA